MICYLNGNMIQKYPEFVILDVNGVGYEVFVPASTLCRLPTAGSAQLYIFSYVREDAFRLYGFMTMFDRTIFSTLLDVSGIGPKAAMALLGAADGFELCDFIIGNQIGRLTNIPGIGAKTAERIILELKAKCQKLLARYREQELFFEGNLKNIENASNLPKNQTVHAYGLLEDLNSALLNLGYKEKQFASLLDTLQKRLQNGEPLTLETMLKESLKKLSEHMLKV